MQTLKHFFLLARPYWGQRQQWQAWLLLSGVLGFSWAVIEVSLHINEWNKSFYDALTNFATEQILPLLLQYLAYIALTVLFIAFGNWLRKLLLIRWRQHLSAEFEQQWLAQRRYYRLTLNDSLPSPDQRIAEDCAMLAEKTVDLVKSLFFNMAKLIAFVGVLWQLSGVQQFQLYGVAFELHGYLVWIALIYSLICSLCTHFIGRKLKPLNVAKQQAEADYRANLLHLQDKAESIAFYQGEQCEQQRLQQAFSQIAQNWRSLMGREFKLECFTASYLRLTNILPVFAVLPLYLAKTMSFGSMMQARSAFSSVQDGFGWFMDFYKRIMEWSATVQRLWEFQQQMQNLPEQLAIAENSQGFFCQDLSLHVPNSEVQSVPLFSPVSVQLKAGQWLQLAGKSGVGKSSLLRTLAGLWQDYQGQFSLPVGRKLFLAQRPYLAQEPLAHLLSYPNPEIYPEADLLNVLHLVGLPHLQSQLFVSQNWGQILSGGEQQRIAFARALLLKPSFLALDESTNQLDIASAQAMLQLVRQQLPTSIVIGITHQPELAGCFDLHMQLQEVG